MNHKPLITEEFQISATVLQKIPGLAEYKISIISKHKLETPVYVSIYLSIYLSVCLCWHYVSAGYVSQERLTFTCNMAKNWNCPPKVYSSIPENYQKFLNLWYFQDKALFGSQSALQHYTGVGGRILQSPDLSPSRLYFIEDFNF